LLPVGKLPPAILESLLKKAPLFDQNIIIGPGPGLDCAVVDIGDKYLVLKSDPISFATDEIGWYLVQVNLNDIATTGAIPKWFLLTSLLPAGDSTPTSAMEITNQVYDACRALGISVVGGHTEITHGLGRPILIGTMIGELEKEKLVTPQGANPGDKILLTKGVPIEATAILAREFPDRLANRLEPLEIKEAKNFLKSPGISVYKDAQLAINAGRVSAMHDPTEGGLRSALWELAEASNKKLIVDLKKVFIPSVSFQVCQAFNIDPYAAISSGALILTTPPDDKDKISLALKKEGLICTDIGWVESGPATVEEGSGISSQTLKRPERDEIAKVYEP
jgi:hydrogenase expression/formation protein HypE